MTVKSKELAEKINPGSYNDFREVNDIASDVEAVERHSDAIHAYRLALAAELGIMLEDLHDRRVSYRTDTQVA